MLLPIEILSKELREKRKVIRIRLLKRSICNDSILSLIRISSYVVNQIKIKRPVIVNEKPAKKGKKIHHF